MKTTPTDADARSRARRVTGDQARLLAACESAIVGVGVSASGHSQRRGECH